MAHLVVAIIVQTGAKTMEVITADVAVTTGAKKELVGIASLEEAAEIEMVIVGGVGVGKHMWTETAVHQAKNLRGTANADEVEVVATKPADAKTRMEHITGTVAD